jgi:regulator of protease activity HflC (stomatin/prohibitin superfamily)
MKRELQADEAAVIVQAHGRPPLLVNGPGSVRTFLRRSRVIVVDLKPLTLKIAVEDVATRDGAHLAVRAEVNARVVNPVDAAIKVVDYSQAVCQITETAIRAVLRGRLSTDLPERLAEVEAQLLDEVASAAPLCGVSVSTVRIQLERGDQSG